MEQEDDLLSSVDVDLATQSLLLASANHDLNAVKDLLKTTSATVQDSDTGFTPLHAAIAACETDGQVDGHHDANTDRSRIQQMTKAAEVVQLLLQNGAIWNDLDANNETPGCIALRLKLDELYQLIVDAGVRAELLLSKLDEYEPLADEDDTDEHNAEATGDDATETLRNGDQVEAHTDGTTDSEAYLRSDLAIGGTIILDSASNGVMMDWEKPIMERSAALLLPTSGLRVLNVGHGMGIIDDFLQSHSPSVHHIIEAHPDVLAKMREEGWMERPGVKVHEGRWQDVLPRLVMGDENGEEILFDAIYFDTFAEEYKALREFFSEWVIQLLDPNGRFGFFNGMGADRRISYDVYQKVAEMDLFEAGLDVEWEELPVPDLVAEGQWNGVLRPYWTLKTYRLPICKFLT